MKKDSKKFPEITIDFLKKLSKNNNREWFEKNRDLFNENFLQPAVQLVVDLGEKLSSISPDIIAIPKIDKSIFRLHRDVRFSKDKSPYKTNLGVYFWEGKRKKMESSGFYFHIDPKLFFLGAGIYYFPNEMLKEYREIVSNPENAKELDSAVKRVKKKGYTIGGKTYKKVPKGFDPDYPYSEYLLYNGLYVSYEDKDLKKLKKDPVNFAFKIYKEMLPIHKWMVKHFG